jgi:segregation and condensation protein B
MYGTTRQFLDYFNLNGLDDLPTLMELRDIDTINAELDLELPGQEHGPGDDEAADDLADATSPVTVQVPVDVADSNGTLH